mmetsp:Transcript_94454/g.137919  ORF Transcript_94454/g.137919 Transcript_94454/m.137919 type:complete len:351 (-) Transcript_94454:37-1089(-)
MVRKLLARSLVSVGSLSLPREEKQRPVPNAHLPHDPGLGLGRLLAGDLVTQDFPSQLVAPGQTLHVIVPDAHIFRILKRLCKSLVKDQGHRLKTRQVVNVEIVLDAAVFVILSHAPDVLLHIRKGHLVHAFGGIFGLLVHYHGGEVGNAKTPREVTANLIKKSVQRSDHTRTLHRPQIATFKRLTPELASVVSDLKNLRKATKTTPKKPFVDRAPLLARASLRVAGFIAEVRLTPLFLRARAALLPHLCLRLNRRHRGNIAIRSDCLDRRDCVLGLAGHPAFTPGLLCHHQQIPNHCHSEVTHRDRTVQLPAKIGSKPKRKSLCNVGINVDKQAHERRIHAKVHTQPLPY